MANKMKNTTIINQANKILISLQKLQDRANKILNKSGYNEDKWYEPHILDLLETLSDLSHFDLEDSIVNAYAYEENREGD